MAKENLSEEQVALLQDDGVDIDALASEVVAETPPETAPEAPPEAETPPDEATPPEQPNAAEAAPAGYVPNQALKEAREEAKNYREELRKMQGWQAEIASKLADQRAMGEQPDEPQIPNAETDPVESIAWTQKQVQEMQQAQQEREMQWQQQYHNQQRQQQIFNAASVDFDQATAADPSIQQAYDFAAESYKNEMLALGTPPEQMQEKIQTFVMGFAHNYLSGAKQRGVPMAEYVKAIAGARGWRPEAPKEEANEAVETIERQQKAQTAAQTLSKTGSGSGETTLQDIAAMDGAELEKFAQENPELFAKLTG